SSRRRHTRWPRDWSSDVCSSDLCDINGSSSSPIITADGRWLIFQSAASDLVPNDTNNAADIFIRDLWAGPTSLVSVGQTNASARSEERRVGKECRIRWRRESYNK